MSEQLNLHPETHTAVSQNNRHGDNTAQRRRAAKDTHGAHAIRKGTVRAQEAEDAGEQG